MGTFYIPNSFQRSYEDFESYPRNIIQKNLYSGALEAYAARLDTAEPNLLTKPEAELYVPFRDLYPLCQGPKTHNILSDDALRKWLGDRSSIDPLTSTRNGAIATKTDPICRFIFISGGNSREPLKISRRMLTRILTYHQVMPCYLDFMSVFGLSKSARELRFSGFRAQVLLKNPTPNSAMPDLGRSGRHFQMCYNLKSVARVPDEKRVVWSIRQAAIYHQFDIEKGTALWIVTKGNLEIKDRIKTLTGKDGRAEDRAFDTPEQCLKSSLAVHLLHCHWSTEDWRWYVQSLEDQIDTETEIAVHGPRGDGEALRVYTSADLQTLQNYQDKMNEVIMVIEANNIVLASLRDFYKAMQGDSTFTLGNACCEDLTLFAKQIDEMKYDSAMQVSRARLLVQITSGRKNLMSFDFATTAVRRFHVLHCHDGYNAVYSFNIFCDLKMAGTWLSDRDNALRELEAKVESFTMKAVCQRSYVLVAELLHWLRSEVHRGQSTTQAGRLLMAAYGPDQSLRASRVKLSDRDNCCLLVFTILLLLGKGDLVHLFQRVDILDKHLPINHQLLREKCRNARIPNADQLAAEFDKKQWPMSPAKFELHSGQIHHEHKILPICKKEEINQKGGTARVYQIEVKEEFVGKTLRQAVAFSRYNCSLSEKEHDWRYQFALKTFQNGSMSLYENEKEAFDALRNQNGIVRLLADYSHAEKMDMDLQVEPVPSGDQEESVTTNTFNLLLEFGEFDLDEYFAQRLPPVFQGETEEFWRALFDVAEALERIHNLDLDTHGIVQQFNGWHADVKPDNILSVQGKFKLSDPGFAKFVKKTDNDPEEFLLGGTETYGAPERHPGRRGTMSAVLQTIDIWSLGCVFSIAATWVVFGYQGIKQFRRIREKAIETMRVRQRGSRSNSNLSAGDYFHDGHRVLETVTSWHRILRSSLRKTDSVTSDLLDLVDQKMLLGNAGARIKSTDLVTELKRILVQSERGPRIEMPGNIMETLLEADKDAVSSVSSTKWSNLGQPAAALNDRKARKSRLLEQPLMKTAHRSEGLKSVLAYHHVQSMDSNMNRNGLTARAKANANPETPHNDSPLHDRPHSIPAPQASVRHLVSPSPSGESMNLTQLHQKAGRTPKVHPPQDLFQALEEIEKRDKHNILGRERKDKLMSRHWKNRDLKFLVDNGESMEPHWAWAKALLKVLVRKIAGQDENGLDLSFVFGAEKLENQKSNSRNWERAMERAKPWPGTRTNMKTPMGEIFSSFLKQVQQDTRHRPTKPVRKLTLIVLTDGIWAGMGNSQASVNEIIVKFVQQVKSVIGDLMDPPVSIEFIQFGNDQEATYRLRQLDSGMKWHGIPDVIDTEHASGDVNKMLLGSFVKEYDDDDDDDDDEDGPMQDPDTATLEHTRSPVEMSSVNNSPASLARASTNRLEPRPQPPFFLSRRTG
ncbi:MAG: hypothetical protein Q9185_001500 [Variospora sp. 1 TL-2023]